MFEAELRLSPLATASEASISGTFDMGSGWPGERVGDGRRAALRFALTVHGRQLVDSFPFFVSLPPPVVLYFLHAIASNGCQSLKGFGCVSLPPRIHRLGARGESSPGPSMDDIDEQLTDAIYLSSQARFSETRR